MNVQYNPTNGRHERMFRQPPEAYPIVDLRHKGYDGPFKLGNFLLHRAIDEHGERVSGLLTKRRLWLIGTFSMGSRRVSVDLQCKPDRTFLITHPDASQLRIVSKWLRRGDANTLDSIKVNQEALIARKNDTATLSLVPARASERRLPSDVLHDPKLGFAVICQDLESDLTAAATRGNLQQYFSIEATL